MMNQQLLVETLVGLADTLVDDYDVIEFMQTLAERSVALLDVEAAGIMLADGDGNLAHIACSSEQMRLVELLELQVQEGPCFDAYRQQVAVRSDTLEDVARRWPSFAPHVRDGHYVAVSAVPLRLRGQGVGALNLFSETPGALDEGDLVVVQAMADIATIGILQQRLIRDQGVLTTQLQTALDSRIIVEQAKGIVAERDRIDVDEAFVRIRKFARDTNTLLADVARGIVVGAVQDLHYEKVRRGQRAGDPEA